VIGPSESKKQLLAAKVGGAPIERKPRQNKSQLADCLQIVNTNAVEVNQIQRGMQISTDLKTINDSKRILQISTDLKTFRESSIKKPKHMVSTIHPQH
jgi:hypothetical protein